MIFNSLLELLTTMRTTFTLMYMSIHKFAFILIVFSLLVGQASASANFESIMGQYGNSFALSTISLLTSDEPCVQDNCACSESDCADTLMMDCADAAGSARCASGMFGVLIFNQSSMTLNLSGSIPLNYNVPIYHDISPGITPRPPKPVV